MVEIDKENFFKFAEEFHVKPSTIYYVFFWSNTQPAFQKEL